MRVLIENLPPDGARSRARKGHSWSDDTYLAAITADRVAEVGAGIIRALGGKASRPKPVPRPDNTPSRLGHRGEADTEAVLTYLDSLKPSP